MILEYIPSQLSFFEKLYYAPPLGHNSTQRKLPFPCFPSVFHSQGEGRKELHRPSQATKGKILKVNNTADNGRHQLFSFSDTKKASSAFNLQIYESH